VVAPRTALDGVHDRSELPSIGSQLKRAREGQGLTLIEAAEETRIHRNFLQALETDGPLDDLPVYPYTRFFLQDYARYLRLDPIPLLRGFDAAHAPPVVPKLPRPAVRPLGKLVPRLLLLASAAVLLVIFARSLGPGAKAPPASSPRPSVLRTASPVSSPTPSPSDVTLPRGVTAVLDLTAPSWISATEDGRVVFTKTFLPGAPLRLFAHQRLDLVLGNGGGVRLRINGKLIPTGSPGAVVRVSFLWRNGRVVIQ